MSRHRVTPFALFAFVFLFTNCGGQQKTNSNNSLSSNTPSGGGIPSGNGDPWAGLGGGSAGGSKSGGGSGTTTTAKAGDANGNGKLEPSELPPGVAVTNSDGSKVSNLPNGLERILFGAQGPEAVGAFSPPVPSAFPLPPPWVPSRTVLPSGGYYDFGGMYGWGWNGTGHFYYPNPVTNAPSCPNGYAPATILGTVNLDYPVVFCFRRHIDGIEADWDFGGMYGFRWAPEIQNHAPYVNPATNAASCPDGYQTGTALGTVNLDYPVNFCFRRHTYGVQERLHFGGAYGYRWDSDLRTHMPYLNPATNGANCPGDYLPSVALGTAFLDYPIVFCYQTPD